MSSVVPETVAERPDLRAERMRILLALLDEVDDLAARALEAIRAEIPAYAEQSERFLSDVRGQLASHYRTKLTAFLEERTVTLEDIAFVRGAATRRARAGFGLEDYLNAFRVGQQVFWEAVVAHAGETQTGHDAALALATPVMRYVDFVSTHAAHAYVEFQQYVVAEADRERRDLLEQLLAGELPSGPLHAAAHTFGIEAKTAMMVAVAVPVGHQAADPDCPTAASAAIARAGIDAARTLVVVRQSEIVAIPSLHAGMTPLRVCECLEQIQRRLQREGIPLAMGIGTVADGVAELPRAYVEARTALACVTDDEGGVTALPRLSAFEYLTLQADGTARRLVDPRVRSFLDEDRARGGMLTATIRAFAAADLNLRSASETLQVHPNTAQYRLGRVEERTGKNPRHIQDLLELLVAIGFDDASVRRT